MCYVARISMQCIWGDFFFFFFFKCAIPKHHLKLIKEPIMESIGYKETESIEDKKKSLENSTWLIRPYKINI